MSFDFAAAEDNEDLEKRLELIEASQSLVQENKEKEIRPHKIGTVFTTYGEGNDIVNTGLRLAPQIASPADMPLRLMGEAIYLRQDDEIAGFLSLSLEVLPNIYLGAGGELTDTADYQTFIGWDLNENIFLELKAINNGGSFSDSEIYPAAGYQMNF
jgi:hypothetical protein